MMDRMYGNWNILTSEHIATCVEIYWLDLESRACHVNVGIMIIIVLKRPRFLKRILDNIDCHEYPLSKSPKVYVSTVGAQ